MELGAVLPMTAEVRDDHLFVGGVDMVELAHKEGTALYVMDEADMRNRMETYLKAFRSRYENSDVIFASKAFLNKETARIVAQEGLCLDVSGGGELWCAQQAGFPMERVFVHGNNKTPQELREAISAGVGRIVVDSRIELGRISKIAGELGVTQDIYMRVTPRRRGRHARVHPHGLRGQQVRLHHARRFRFQVRQGCARGPERAPGRLPLPHRLADLRAAFVR